MPTCTFAEEEKEKIYCNESALKKDSVKLEVGPLSQSPQNKNTF